MWVKNQKLEPDMEQVTDAKLGKEYKRAVYCHSAYLLYMQSMSCEMPGWMNHKLESRLPRRNIKSLRCAEELMLLNCDAKEPLDDGERGE